MTRSAVLWRLILAAQWIVEGPLTCTDEQMYIKAGKPSRNKVVRLGDPTKLRKGKGGEACGGSCLWIYVQRLMYITSLNPCYDPESFYCVPVLDERLGSLNPSV